MQGEVVSLKTTHNIIKRSYKDHKVTFIFDGDRRQWSWTYEHTMHTTFSGGGCPSLDDAIKRAYHSLDTLVG